MKSTEFYIQELELSLEPNVEDVDVGGIEIEFEVVNDPKYDEETQSLQSVFEITLDLKRYGSPLGDTPPVSDEEENEVGEIVTEVIAAIEGSEEEFEEYISTWESDGYRSLPWEFRFHVESALISEVLSPVSGLVENSFRGILPMISLSEPPQTEQNELEEIDDDLEEELTDKLSETVEEVLEGTEYDIGDIVGQLEEEEDEEDEEEETETE
ncbi:hypothetical protein [Halobacterium sp. KA-6]|uniref:hypothetical protein n=1 Tax=Halobacterium sp. KA-6 TaxID=2896368 RepID=UPI001E4EEFC1|nr:hypothetical protein [Halobacterium sp. KA-6]MCD2205295.1 hypothetical protein [Halobacterium sp. KA-6]